MSSVFLLTELKEQLLNSYFHAIVPRTAGFNSEEMTELTLGSLLAFVLTKRNTKVK